MLASASQDDFVLPRETAITRAITGALIWIGAIFQAGYFFYSLLTFIFDVPSLSKSGINDYAFIATIWAAYVWWTTIYWERIEKGERGMLPRIHWAFYYPLLSLVFTACLYVSLVIYFYMLK